MRKNRRAKKGPPRTHEGALAFAQLTPEQRLRRSLMSCMLWEEEFYEDGASIAERLLAHAAALAPERLAEIAIEAREQANLRHAPLLLLSALSRTGARKPGLVSGTIARVIQRADELSEFLAIYWRNGKKPLSAQVKKGLAAAFQKFDAYELAKYDRDTPVKLRDVMFLVHPKPRDSEQEALWQRLANREMAPADTWEVALSAGTNKKKAFERLLTEQKLGYLALLRNIRKMMSVGVDQRMIKKAILARKGAERVLPFRYVAAARACPAMDETIDKALQAAIAVQQPLQGATVVLVDVSGSMAAKLSRRSDLNRMDAAATLASIINTEQRRIFTFSANVVEVPARRGMAGIDAIIKSQHHGSTELGKAVARVNAIAHDRLIVITDEQSADYVPDPVARLAYMINVASATNGVGYGRWVHIDGFSEQVLRFIGEYEKGLGEHAPGHA
ncbi:MAG: TROVE domain-containing protein [Hyphomicrobiaceae bacterium]